MRSDNQKRAALLVSALLLATGLTLWFWLRPGPAQVVELPVSRESVTDDTPSDGPHAAAPLIARPAVEEPAPLHLHPAAVHDDPGAVHGSMSGLVVSHASGRGVPGAELTFMHGGAAHAVTADARGRFMLAAVEPGRYELAAATAEDHLPYAPPVGQSPIAFVARPGQRVTDVIVYLTPAIWYQGVVVSPDHEPVAGASVRIVDRRAAAQTLVPSAPPVISDAAGRFGIQAADYAWLEARHPDYSPGQMVINFAAQVSRQLLIRLTALDDRLSGDEQIVGRVLGPDGKGLEGAVVRASLLPPNQKNNPYPPVAPVQVASERGGRFVLTGLHPGPYHLAATYEGLMSATAPAAPAGGGEVVLRLRAGGSLQGSVVTEATGAPVPAFTVVVELQHGRKRRGPARTSAVFDGQGRYRITGLQRGMYFVRVAAHGYTPSAEQRVRVSGNPGRPARADFSLEHGSRIHGVVLSEDTGQPLAGARVSGEGRLTPDSGMVPVVASTSTGPDGRFELFGMSRGLRSVIVRATGHHGRIISGLQVEPDGDIGPLRIELASVDDDEEARLELTGIGAVLATHGTVLVIRRVVDGGGAQEAGMVPGDVILAVDGQSVRTMSLQDAVELIRGPEDSSVLLGVKKAGTGQDIELLIYRRRIRP